MTSRRPTGAAPAPEGDPPPHESSALAAARERAELAGALGRARRENETLYTVIKTVASSLDLDRVLAGIVSITTRATDCHACFVYFVERDCLVLRAASPRYAHLVGELRLGPGEGLTGWVAETGRSEFIRDSALADPRMKYVPELEEERFQSMVAVPVLAKRGEVLGVIVLHTEAPREFDEEVLNFLVHTASLVAGAIENAQLFEAAHRRVASLTGLAELSEAIAAARVADELQATVARGARRLLGVEASHCFRVVREAGTLELVASDPPEARAPHPRAEGTAMLLEILRERARAGSDALVRALWPGHDESALVAAPLSGGDEDLGVLCLVVGKERAPGSEELDLLSAIASQAALGLEKTALIERLAAKNTVKDLFEALAARTSQAAGAKAAEAGCDLSAPHVFLHAERAAEGDDSVAWPEVARRLEAGLRRPHPRALFDSSPDRLRALVPLGRERPEAAVESLLAICRELGAAECGVLGLSGRRTGSSEGRRGMREAADAMRVGRALAPAGGAHCYDSIGAYRYLVRLRPEDAPRDRYRQAVDALLAYDASRRTELVKTLSQLLCDRGSVAASARALYVHPNTVRQRLKRIEKLSGLELADEDLLSLELALKLARLQDADQPAQTPPDAGGPGSRQPPVRAGASWSLSRG